MHSQQHRLRRRVRTSSPSACLCRRRARPFRSRRGCRSNGKRASPALTVCCAPTAALLSASRSVPADPPQLDANSVGNLIPRPAFLINKAEYRKLLIFLRKVGLVTFRDPRTLPKHPVTGQVLAAGILGADKKSGAQRLILDRRPLNAIEERLVGLSLPFAGDFVRFDLGPSEVIRTSLRDGKDQYYVLRPDDARIE